MAIRAGLRQSSQERILAYLRRWAGTDVQGFARALGLAPMTIRHHLARLEAAGFVSAVAESQRASAGRPALRYSLTLEADDLFPKAYDRLARLLLDELAAIDGAEIAGLASEEKQALLLGRLARRAAGAQRERLDRLAGRERARAAAAILQEESGFTDLNEGDAALEVFDYNCIYRSALRLDDDDVCRFHTLYVSELMGVPVQLSASQRSGAEACCFHADFPKGELGASSTAAANTPELGSGDDDWETVFVNRPDRIL